MSFVYKLLGANNHLWQSVKFFFVVHSRHAVAKIVYTSAIVGAVELGGWFRV